MMTGSVQAAMLTEGAGEEPVEGGAMGGGESAALSARRPNDH